jgi:hypothetical protein
MPQSAGVPIVVKWHGPTMRDGRAMLSARRGDWQRGDLVVKCPINTSAYVIDDARALVREYCARMSWDGAERLIAARMGAGWVFVWPPQ